MARKRDRAFAAFGAALFLLTSSALTIAVVVNIIQDHNAKKQAANTSQPKETKVQDKLEGKPLAGFTPVAHIDQLQKIDTQVGTGEEVKAGQTVTVDYTGAVASTGTVFQSSKDSGKPIALSLSQVIAGWSQGIPGMKVGGTRRLLIPASLAYGSQSQPGIPANSDLVFDVTVYSIQK